MQELPFDEDDPPISCSFIQPPYSPVRSESGRSLKPASRPPATAAAAGRRPQDPPAASSRRLLPRPPTPPISGIEELQGDPTFWKAVEEAGGEEPGEDGAEPSRMLKPPPTPPPGAPRDAGAPDEAPAGGAA